MTPPVDPLVEDLRLLRMASGLAVHAFARRCKLPVATWARVRRAMKPVQMEVAALMAPACVQCGYCPELRECAPGANKVMAAYGRVP